MEITVKDIYDKDPNKIIETRDKVKGLIPRTRTSPKRLIKAFEKIDKACGGDDPMGDSVRLFNLSSYMYKTKDPDFEMFDTFFKKVHKHIRNRAVKSKHFEECLYAIAKANFEDDSGYYYGKFQMTEAYHKTLDEYDPNVEWIPEEDVFNWSGFWSLIGTENGEIIGCYLGDTADREMFYGHIKHIPNPDN